MTLYELWVNWNDVNSETKADVYAYSDRQEKIVSGKLRNIACDKKYRDRNVRIFGSIMTNKTSKIKLGCFDYVKIILEEEVV